VTTPPISAHVRSPLGLYRVSVNVARHCHKVLFRFYQNRPIAAPKQRAISTVGSVKSLGVDPIDMSHHSGKGGGGCPKKKVIVIAHEAIRIDLEAPHPGSLAKQIQKTLPILIVEKNPLPGRAAIHNVIVGAGIFNPQGT